MKSRQHPLTVVAKGRGHHVVRMWQWRLGHGTCYFPEPSRPVRAASQDRPAIWTENDRENIGGMIHRRAKLLAGRRVPKPGRPVVTSRSDGHAVGAKRD